MSDFITALKQRDLEKIKLYPKSDLHNHFVLGGSRHYLQQITGVKINPIKKELYKIIPIDTLRFLVNTATPSVIATYVYLLSKWEWKGKNYIFTSEELIKNCLGMKSTTNSRDYEKINDILDCLYNNGLIDYEDIYIKKNNKVIAKKQLIRVSKTYNSKRK